MKMGLALNNLQKLICHKTKPNQSYDVGKSTAQSIVVRRTLPRQALRYGGVKESIESLSESDPQNPGLLDVTYTEQFRIGWLGFMTYQPL